MTEQPDIRRRRLVIGVASAAGAGVLLGGLAWARDDPRGTDNAEQGDASAMVTIVMFDDHGQRLGERRVARIVKTAAEWKQQLSAQAYNITRQAGTEPPFSGDYSKPDKPGMYRCVCCDTALYDAATQFHSGTGWPSFWQPIAKDNVSRHTDHSFGMARTEIRCTRCEAHLGHVFHDGPQPTGLRYCMNSAALHFVPTGAAGGASHA